MRERVTVVTLSVCHFFIFGEGAVFRVETYISTSPLNVALFLKIDLEKKRVELQP